MHDFVNSILCVLLPLVLADTSYEFRNVQFQQYNTSSNSIKEIVKLGVRGTTPGATVVRCDLAWNASTAAQVPATGPPLVEQFHCQDPAVNVSMQRMTVSFFGPWYLTVSLNNANPVTWNPWGHGPMPVREGKTNDSKLYVFDREIYTISGAPSVSLPEALRQSKAQNGTSTQPSSWQGFGGSGGQSSSYDGLRDK